MAQEGYVAKVTGRFCRGYFRMKEEYDHTTLWLGSDT